MDSANENFTISSQESLLLHHDQQQLPPPKQTKSIKNLKTSIIFALLLLVTIISVSIIFPSKCKKSPKPERLDAYLSGSSRFYCDLTPHPELCYTSMSSIINTTALESKPGPIFAASFQLSINELNNTTISIAKSLNNPLVGPRLSKCQTLVHDAIGRLNTSLGLLGNDSDIESLTYVEMDDFRAGTMAASVNVGKCFLALEEIDDMMVGGEDEKMGVEEVKVRVEKANKLIINGILLFETRESILGHFYNPLIDYGDCDYDYFFYNFEYRFLACLYSAMYLFLALLYFLFWRSN